MLHGVFALLFRSLRADSRSWQAHLARVGLMGAIYVSLISAYLTSIRFGAPGLGFFKSIVWLNVTFMTLLGIGYFSTAISEEKEEDTLGLMQMAGINPLGILLGKIGGRLGQALLLIAVQYPFTLLAVTLGGVTPNQVTAAFVGLTAFMLMLAGLGLLCSTVAARNRSASALMVLSLLVYTVVPYLSLELQRYAIANRLLAARSLEAEILTWVSASCVYLQIEEILVSSFGESPWSKQAISNLAIGGLCSLAAWGLFDVCTRNPTTEALSRGLLTRQRGPFRWFSPGRPLANPFVWKDFHFVAGGVAMLLARIGLYLAVPAFAFGLATLWWGPSGRFWHEVIGMSQAFLLVVVTFESALMASSVLYDEVRGQTLASLVMLPESSVYVMYSKFLGAFTAAFVGPLFLILACITSAEGLHNTGEFFEEPAGWFFFAHFVLVPHLAAILSLYVRWGAVPLAIGMGIGSVVGWVSFFQATGISPRDGAVAFVGLLVFAACVACHPLVIWRVKVLGAR